MREVHYFVPENREELSLLIDKPVDMLIDCRDEDCRDDLVVYPNFVVALYLGRIENNDEFISQVNFYGIPTNYIRLLEAPVEMFRLKKLIERQHNENFWARNLVLGYSQDQIKEFIFRWTNKPVYQEKLKKLKSIDGMWEEPK